MIKICGLCNKDIKDLGGYYIYTDLKHGIENDTITCKPCYARHMITHYPDSTITKHIQQNPTEYLLPEQRVKEAQMQPTLFEASNAAPR